MSKNIKQNSYYTKGLFWYIPHVFSTNGRGFGCNGQFLINQNVLLWIYWNTGKTESKSFSKKDISDDQRFKLSIRGTTILYIRAKLGGELGSPACPVYKTHHFKASHLPHDDLIWVILGNHELMTRFCVTWDPHMFIRVVVEKNEIY